MNRRTKTLHGFPFRIEKRKGKPFYILDLRRIKKKLIGSVNKAKIEQIAKIAAEENRKLGIEGMSFPVEMRVMALDCVKQLQPYGKTLLQATSHYITFLDQQKAISESKLITVLVDEWLTKKKNSGLKPLSEATKYELTKMGNKLKVAFPSQRIAEVQSSDIRDYIENLEVKNQTKSNILQKWGQFWNWCIASGYTLLNPCSKVEVSVWGNEIKRYSATQVKEFFEICESKHIELLPYLAIATFAGVRPGECKDLRWEYINLETKEIEVKKSTASNADRTRFVPIEDNLNHWLRLVHKESGSVIPPNFVKKFVRFQASCGFKIRTKNPDGPKFIDDGLRHTFASFYHNKYHNIAKLAYIMGNSAGVLNNHYLKAVSASEVASFWEILPKNMAEKLEEERAENQKIIDSFSEEAVGYDPTSEDVFSPMIDQL